jgi:hypothetical protein
MAAPREFSNGSSSPQTDAKVTGSFAQSVHRKIGWNKVGVAIGLLIVAAAAVALFNLLRDIDFDKVEAALRQCRRRRSCCRRFVALGHFADLL